MHVRTQLRNAVKAALAAGVTGLRGGVGGVRQFAWNTDRLPAIEVSTPSGVDDRMDDEGTVRRGMTLVVAVFLQGHGDIEDQADAFAVQIEPILVGTVQSGPFAWSVDQISTNFSEGGGGDALPAQLVIAVQMHVFSEMPDLAVIT